MGSVRLERARDRTDRGAALTGSLLLDLLGPPGLAGGAVADFVLVIFRFGATMELGRSERTTMRPLLRPLWSYGVDAANTPDRKPR